MRIYLNYLKLIPIHLITILAPLQMTQRRKKNLLVLKAMILFVCILKKWEMLSCLSREGEIAIAKRIESGLDKMMNSILECPASIDILKKWIDQVKLQEINLREIVDFDEYFNEENDPYSNSSKRKEIQKIINDKKKALLKEKQQLMKEQGIEIDKEKLEETASEEDVENESFSISIIEEFYKPEILKKLDRVLVLSENITKIKKNKNITKISDTKSLKDLKKYPG